MLVVVGIEVQQRQPIVGNAPSPTMARLAVRERITLMHTLGTPA